MAKSVGLTVFFYLVPVPLGALGQNHEAIVAWIVVAVRTQKLDHAIKIELVFGNPTANRGDVSGVQGRVSGITTKNAEDAYTLVRTDRCTLPLNGILSTRD